MNHVPRVAAAEDVAALVDVINRAYRVEAFFHHGERTDAADVRERLARPGALFLVIEDEGLAGAIFLKVTGERGYFGMLSVDPDRQKQGIGRRLVDAAESHCRTAGCRFLDIDVVNLRTELPAFYRHLGFAPYGTEPFHRPELLKQPAHLILMTKPLVDLWDEADVNHKGH